MAEPLKHILNEEVIRDLAVRIKRAYPDFDQPAFVARSSDGLEALGLSARAAHIADALHAYLPQPFPAAAEVLLATLGPEAAPDESGLNTLRYWPYSCFVQKHGLQDFEPAMRFQYALTKRFSAEFSIRSYLIKYPDLVYARLMQWGLDDNVHVRRLVSEGTRPRLPWASRLSAFQQNPEPVIRLLERLKDDAQRYVQRSVANNLNDISKDHPELVIAICRRWREGASPGRLWIIKHALRTLVKKGNHGALEISGAEGKPEVDVALKTPLATAVVMGDKLHFAFAITSTREVPQNLLVDYAVHFVKANGSKRPKVFKLRRIVLRPREHAVLNGTVSFANMTTRRHYPGRHSIDILINGVVFPLGAFDVLRK